MLLRTNSAHKSAKRSRHLPNKLCVDINTHTHTLLIYICHMGYIIIWFNITSNNKGISAAYVGKDESAIVFYCSDIHPQINMTK